MADDGAMPLEEATYMIYNEKHDRALIIMGHLEGGRHNIAAPQKDGGFRNDAGGHWELRKSSDAGKYVLFNAGFDRVAALMDHLDDDAGKRHNLAAPKGAGYKDDPGTRFSLIPSSVQGKYLIHHSDKNRAIGMMDHITNGRHNIAAAVQTGQKDEAGYQWTFKRVEAVQAGDMLLEPGLYIIYNEKHDRVFTIMDHLEGGRHNIAAPQKDGGFVNSRGSVWELRKSSEAGMYLLYNAAFNRVASMMDHLDDDAGKRHNVAAPLGSGCRDQEGDRFMLISSSNEGKFVIHSKQKNRSVGMMSHLTNGRHNIAASALVGLQDEGDFLWTFKKVESPEGGAAPEVMPLDVGTYLIYNEKHDRAFCMMGHLEGGRHNIAAPKKDGGFRDDNGGRWELRRSSQDGQYLIYNAAFDRSAVMMDHLDNDGGMRHNVAAPQAGGCRDTHSDRFMIVKSSAEGKYVIYSPIKNRSVAMMDHLTDGRHNICAPLRAGFVDDPGTQWVFKKVGGLEVDDEPEAEWTIVTAGGLAESGSSVAGSATQAVKQLKEEIGAANAEDEQCAGLAALLAETRVPKDAYDPALMWCSEIGIDKVDALWEDCSDEDIDQLVAAMKLKRLPERRLRSRIAEMKAAQQEPEPDEELAEKFMSSARQLLFGETKVAAKGIKAKLGICDEELGKALMNPLEAVKHEVDGSGTKDDQENLKYIMEGRAQESLMPSQVLVDIENGHYHGGVLLEGEYDMGHKGMTMKDFMCTEQAEEAELTEAELVCIRLYTTSSYRMINNPMRAPGNQRHPWALTVYFLSEGLKKLRAVKASLDPEGFVQEKILWRGMQNMKIDEVTFRKLGGTEMACMSTTEKLDIALSYAKSDCPLLLKYRTMGMTCGVPVDWCSVYPKEREYLYPPLTVITHHDVAREQGIRVIEVKPQMV